MVCELIAVGTELLLGSIANTDAQALSQRLSEHGVNVYYHTVCGDNPERLVSALEIAISRADIIITTGGLGPTADDLTKETIASAFGKKLYMDKAQQERLHARMKGRMTPNNEKQAMLPEGCTVFENDWGTAPGCAFYARGKHVMMLPGPPSECIPLFVKCGLPYLDALGKGVIQSRYVRIFGMGESKMESILAPLMNSLENPTAAPYAEPGECKVRVTARADTAEQALAMCDPVVRQICDTLGDVVYGIDVDSLEDVVVHGLSEQKLTLAVAESCTGGYLSKRITDIPGSSACFSFGCVTYSNEMKEKVLGVPHDTLDNYGAVSPETALAMARGVRKVAQTDIGVGITGIAGPDGGTQEKPVGTVYIAISHQGGEKVILPNIFRPERERIRHTSASTALDLIRREVLR